MLTQPDYLSHIDFEQGEQIELSTNIDTEQYSNRRYFSTRAQFIDRFNALMGWASKNNVNTVCGTIVINNDFLVGKNLSVDSVEEAIAEFEDFLITHIRVPRNYSPPVGSESRKRKSDDPGYRSVKGSFDLASRNPGTESTPHILDFVLYDCSYADALKKAEVLVGYAQDLGLSAQVDVFNHSGRNTRARKTKRYLTRGMKTISNTLRRLPRDAQKTLLAKNAQFVS